ncbi:MULTISPECIES: HD-GYP domain-containing protein [Paenibacillus]|uniref:HD family phosphohydrolase n=1 Tax=Paenibacillus azoreducens TaxID=116718 RepID=A0A919YC69_9BACL|nr:MULTISPECIES: HD-GYP domain-containing protein [Paenibacillus]MBE9912486.1 HD-GYP domain-containing protein [Paenibacillus donghaensis]GIO45832.1 HD family phosphohydrolase [Paenibacillus azoreducens]
MKVHVTDLKPGDRLLADTFNEAGLHVLQQGTELKEEEIHKLMQHGVDYVDIEPAVQQPAIAMIHTQQYELLQKTKPYLEQAVDGFESMYLEALATGRFNEGVVDDIMEPLVDQLKEHKDIVSLMLCIDQNDDYTYIHSMQVGILSYYIASWLGFSKEEAYEAGRAGYLHDIGKCQIPGSLLNKPGKLTFEEFEEMKKHTIYGHDIICSSTPDTIPALVALQHHERDDGSGYPHAIEKNEIHPFSRITAVADVFSAMSMNRVYQSKQELLTVLRELHTMSFGKLSANATQVFIRHMLPNFIGKNVILSTGERGTIVMTNPADFFRPLVNTGDRFVDLSAEHDIGIDQIFL